MDGEQIKLWGAIIVTTIAKWLLTDEGAPEGETAAQRRRRIRRGLGGIIAGILSGYYGYEPVIRWVGFFSDQDTLIVAIGLALTGEHIMRAAMVAIPQAVQRAISRAGGGSNE